MLDIFIVSVHVCVCVLCHLDENRILDSLPIKMNGDLAIHVHLDTICKVALFQVNHLNTNDLILKALPWFV